MKAKQSWRERVVLSAYYIAVIAEGLIYLCSLSLIRTHFGGDVLFSKWATDFEGK